MPTLDIVAASANASNIAATLVTLHSTINRIPFIFICLSDMKIVCVSNVTNLILDSSHQIGDHIVHIVDNILFDLRFSRTEEVVVFLKKTLLFAFGVGETLDVVVTVQHILSIEIDHFLTKISNWLRKILNSNFLNFSLFGLFCSSRILLIVKTPRLLRYP